jgi:hypothetical protein
MSATTKLPMSDKPLILDPDLAKAIGAILEPLEGEELRVAQAAIRKVRQSGVQGSFSGMLEAYRKGIEAAVADVRRSKDRKAKE